MHTCDFELLVLVQAGPSGGQREKLGTREPEFESRPGQSGAPYPVVHLPFPVAQ